jgi:AcrR family transcriptional regulator
MPKVVDHDAYRAELLTRSFDLFATLGYRAVTMRGIATHLGVSTGTLYHYFATKEEIFEQMVSLVAVRAVEQALQGVATGATPFEKLDSVFRFVSEHEVYLRNFLFLVIDYHRSQLTDEGNAVVRNAIRFFRDAIEVHAGSLPPALAGLILSGLLGSLLLRTLDDNPLGFDEQSTYIRTLLTALNEA